MLRRLIVLFIRIPISSHFKPGVKLRILGRTMAITVVSGRHSVGLGVLFKAFHDLHPIGISYKTPLSVAKATPSVEKNIRYWLASIPARFN